METTSYIISTIGVLAALIALLVTLWQFKKRKEAEKKLYKLMNEKLMSLNLNEDTISQFQRIYSISKEGLLKYEDFSKLMDSIEEILFLVFGRDFF